MKDIKVKVTLEFSVNLEEWANEYGLEPGQAKADAAGMMIIGAVIGLAIGGQ